MFQLKATCLSISRFLFVFRSRALKIAHPLGTRIFVLSFPPMCVALIVAFFTIHTLIRARIKEGLKDSLHRAESVLDKLDVEHTRRNREFVSILSENAGLKAAVGLFREVGSDSQVFLQARRTLLAQIQELITPLDYDLCAVFDSEGHLLVALVDGKPRNINPTERPEASLMNRMTKVGAHLYETTNVPINLGNDNLGSLTVGKKFDLGLLIDGSQAALFEGGRLLLTTFSLPNQLLERELAQQCGTQVDGCELGIEGGKYLALKVNRTNLTRPYQLFGFQAVDTAMAKLTQRFTTIFLAIGVCGIVFALVLSLSLSRSVSQPLGALITHLRQSERTGQLLPNLQTEFSTQEVRELAQGLNRAAAALQDSQTGLDVACVQFVETMAQALDARDPYTAGHSNRVSDYAVAIAELMGVSAQQIEIIRIGARLHDIGKIGIPDSVLQKPGKLSAQEFELIKNHPQIGRKILEKVGRFEGYLSIVELHHENHDGSGYPYGLKGQEIPLDARIVHVADVYDAITSDRSYRNAMPLKQVLEIFEDGAGRHFDPEVVSCFLALLQRREVEIEPSLTTV